ncbi:SIR2 family protein [Bdellovibrio sp. HCB337]|uniref:SIR2 family protein n=1 Tax=Bdellovibrio sp. HCB337 TaxID=3394358 RepID=UPI0039A6C98E
MDKNSSLFDSDIDEYNKNSIFNEEFDSEGEVDVKGYRLLPSKILFHSDKVAYFEELELWRENKKSEKIELVTEILKNFDNKGRLTDLIRSIRNKRALPFVGAGMSVPSGMPGWSKFLKKCAEEGSLDAAHIDMLIKDGKFEDCADLIIKHLTEDWFNQKFRYNFSSEISDIKGAVQLLPDLFSSGIITTNFDNVLEKVFIQNEKAFEHISIGPKNDFSKYLSKGIHSLFKIHGDIYSPADRVLTKREYDAAYGNMVDSFGNLIPKFIKHVSTSYCLLFLGCSLTQDRTMSVLRSIKELHQSEGLGSPEHFAILSLPEAEEERVEREKLLIKHSIFPIWYPTEEHEYIEYILTFVLEQI